MVDDRQTHSLPDDEAGVAAIATFLGYRRFAVLPEGPAATACAASRATTPTCSRRRRASPAPAATWCSPAPTTIPARWRPCRRWASAIRRRRPASCGAGTTAATARPRTARARELLTELMPGLLKALGATAAPDQALLNFDLFLGNLPAGVQLFSLFKANPALLELVAAIMGSAPGPCRPSGAPHHPARFGAVARLLSCRCRRSTEMRADLAAISWRSVDARAGHPRPGAALGQRPALPGRRAAAQARSCGPAAGGPRLFRHRRRHDLRAVRPRRAALRRARMAASAASGWPCWAWASSAAARCRPPPTST